jgi:hypothetical protein
MVSFCSCLCFLPLHHACERGSNIPLRRHRVELGQPRHLPYARSALGAEVPRFIQAQQLSDSGASGVFAV